MGKKYLIQEVTEKDHGITVGIIVLAILGLIAYGSAQKDSHNSTSNSQPIHLSR